MNQSNIIRQCLIDQIKNKPKKYDLFYITFWEKKHKIIRSIE